MLMEEENFASQLLTITVIKIETDGPVWNLFAVRIKKLKYDREKEIFSRQN